MVAIGGWRVRLAWTGRYWIISAFLIFSVWYVLRQHNIAEDRHIHFQSSSTKQKNSQSKRSTKKVSFIVGGVQKSGTTALCSYLAKHPHLCLSFRKELHFFDDEDINWEAPPYKKYESSRQFPKRKDMCGECTPIYIYWPDSLERIKVYNPDIKLIFIFRQPVQRAWSQWKMETAEYRENKSFSWAIREGRRRVESGFKSEGQRKYSYVERGFYGKQVERVLELFSRQQVLLLLSEDLQIDPTKTIRQISKFLQVREPTRKIKPLTENARSDEKVGAVLGEDDAMYLQNLFNDDLKLFAQLSGLNITSWFT